MMRAFKVAAMAVVVLAAAGVAPASAQDTGKIKGKMTLKGGSDNLPGNLKRRPINTTAADPNCTHKIGTFDVIAQKSADGSGLQNVLLTIKEGLPNQTWPVPSEPVILDQKGCQYEPHIIPVVKGQKMTIRNSDATTHNIHGLPQKNAEFNFSQPKQGMTQDKTFEQVETFRVKCDVHPWMGAYIAVFDHPFFAVSGKDGTFEIANVPPGEYTIEAWHETLGTMSGKVSVAAGGEAEFNLEFEAK